VNENHPIAITARLLDAGDETWKLKLEVSTDWLSAGHEVVEVPGVFRTRETALETALSYVAGALRETSSS
jgi:hypothetical protein